MSLTTLHQFRDLVATYTSMTVVLANGVFVKPFSKVDNVIVHVDRLKFHTDFIILEMTVEKEEELLFGRPLLQQPWHKSTLQMLLLSSKAEMSILPMAHARKQHEGT